MKFKKIVSSLGLGIKKSRSQFCLYHILSYLIFGRLLSQSAPLLTGHETTPVSKDAVHTEWDDMHKVLIAGLAAW